MALNGAKHLYAVDISKINTIKTKNTLKNLTLRLKLLSLQQKELP